MRLKSYETGIWIWGLLLVFWLLWVVMALWSGFERDLPCPPGRSGGSDYCVIQNNGAVVAAITVVLGVIWSWFLQMQQKRRELDLKQEEIRKKPG